MTRHSPARKNNFDLLRLLFAGSVVLWHAYDLSRHPALYGMSRFVSADIGVKGFFVVSGYLVLMSFENSSSLRDYAAKRIRRIYPAYCTIIIACALCGAVLSTLPVGEYFSAPLARYLAANLVFLNFLAPTLPGVFEGNTWREVNGALWTLKIEVMFYAIVPFVVLAYRRFGAPAVLTALYAMSVAYSGILGAVVESSDRPLWAQLQRQLPGQLTYFVAGALLYLYREQIARRWLNLLAVAFGLWLVQQYSGSPLVRIAVEPIWMAIAVIYAACGLPYLGNFARFGDLSYGLYIIHFPVIQAAVGAGYFDHDPVWSTVATLAITLLLAYLSWHLVERPFLSRRSHYRLAEASVRALNADLAGRKGNG